jgi:hypothetical protein
MKTRKRGLGREERRKGWKRERWLGSQISRKVDRYTSRLDYIS